MSVNIMSYSSVVNLILQKNKKKKNSLIRVFKGGQCCNQYTAFLMAVGDFPPNSFIIEYLDNDTIKEWGFTVADIVDWLMKSDIHVILTHIHQGLSQCNYNMVLLYEELQKLRCHPGFPNYDYLQCPIFSQDKYKYIEILNEGGYCNPTLKIILNQEHEYNYLLKDIEK